MYIFKEFLGSIKFHLLDGFPTKPLMDYDKTLHELNLQNSLLTKKYFDLCVH